MSFDVCEFIVQIAQLLRGARASALRATYFGYWISPKIVSILLENGGVMAKKLFSTVFGLVLVLGWWTLRDKIWGGPSTAAASDRIPAKVWEGGNVISIDVESSDPALLRVLFEASTRNNGKAVRSLDTYEKVSAGAHSWTIDVPSAVGGDLEFEADHPKPGSHLKWTVRSGSRVLAQDDDTLKEPLQANEAFFLKFDADDFASNDASE